ncbi:MAG: hypothetical protein JXR53_15945 [Bacteroidales bacterium]|nr:hypothetical protein [Bacteroidales bacterium]
MKWFMLIIGILALIATIGMYYLGTSDPSHLDELLAFWWYPLPLAAIGFTAFFRMNSKKS